MATHTHNTQGWWGAKSLSAAVLVALFGLVGCGEGGVMGGGPPPAPGEPSAPGEIVDTSLMISSTSMTGEELVMHHLQGDLVELRSPFSFAALRLFIVVNTFPEIEFSAELEDGTRTPYELISYDVQDETGETLAQLYFPTKARAVTLRFAKGPEQVDYLDARFYADATPGEELPFHLEELHAHDELEDAWELEDVTDDPLLLLTQSLTIPGAYVPSPAAEAAGNAQTVAFEGSPSRASGTFTPGARQLGTDLRTSLFPGKISSVGGYSNRNIAGSRRLSVHASGRALDLMIPMSNPRSCGANNTAGDEIANWLITNAESIGLVLLIWDDTIWKTSGRYANGKRYKRYETRSSSCTQRHNDHIHMEISTAAGNRQTSYFRGGNTQPPVPVEGGGQGTNPNPTQPRPITCTSATLGRNVPQGSCVQQASARACGWFQCSARNSYTTLTNGLSTCQADSTYAHVSCPANTQPNPMPTPPVGRAGQLVATLSWDAQVDLDINALEPSGTTISHSRSARSPNDGNRSECNPVHRICHGEEGVFSERIVWGEQTRTVASGNYELSVRNFTANTNATFTLTLELYDEEGVPTVLDRFTGSSSSRTPTVVGRVAVP